MSLNHELGQVTAGAGWPTAVAVEVLLLWPRGVTSPSTTAEEAGLWPVFAMVVTEPANPAAAQPLFELLARQKHDNELTVVTAQTRWSVLDSASALLDLRVRATAPVEFDLRILLPSQKVLGILDVVARGATVGITTRAKADRLRGRVDIGAVLREVVLLSCPPSVELSTLAHILHDAEEDRPYPSAGL